ncbi:MULTISPECIES: serine hydrolase [unclassified Streptomyces]|uniref:serine hydrolase n=1 Tax=unclassified Streptomyces TaxID=2593676 RepID=UPI00338FF61D
MEEQTSLRDVPSPAAGSSVAGARTTATQGPPAATAESCFRIASLTKVFTSTALVRTLRDKGVPLGTPVVELLPALAPDWRADKSLTIEQILVERPAHAPTCARSHSSTSPTCAAAAARAASGSWATRAR